MNHCGPANPHARRTLVRFVLGTVVGALLLLPTAASAHTELQSSLPEDGAEVADPPSDVVLIFTTPVADREAAQVTVTDPTGVDLVGGAPTVSSDLTVVTVPLNLAVDAGDYVIEWTVISADDDPVSGTILFTLAPPEAVLTPLPATDGPVVEPAAEATAEPAAQDPTEVETPPEPTVEPDATSPEDQATELEADLAASDDGSPVVGIILGGLALLAIAAVFVLRVRNSGPLSDGDLPDGDKDS